MGNSIWIGHRTRWMADGATLRGTVGRKERPMVSLSPSSLLPMHPFSYPPFSPTLCIQWCTHTQSSTQQKPVELRSSYIVKSGASHSHVRSLVAVVGGGKRKERGVRELLADHYLHIASPFSLHTLGWSIQLQCTVPASTSTTWEEEEKGKERTQLIFCWW